MLTGTNSEEIKSTVGGIQGAYDELIYVLSSGMQTKFVNEMQDKWACRHAQAFFKEFEVKVNELIETVNAQYLNIVDVINEAARAYENTHGSEWNGLSLNEDVKRIDVSCIKENINGVRGIDLDAKDSVTANLTDILKLAMEASSRLTSAVENTGFYSTGNSNSTMLQASLGKIKSKLDDVLEELTSSCKTAVQETVEEYEDLSAKVSSAFSGQ